MNYRNAKFGLDEISIDCEVDYPGNGWVALTCEPGPPAPYFDLCELYDTIIADGEVSHLTPEEADEKVSDIARSQRNRKLEFEVDPWVTNPLRWESLSPAKQQEWLDYRISLLDLPQQEGWPHNIVWPLQPA
jgi:hypothetical protein